MNKDAIIERQANENLKLVNDNIDLRKRINKAIEYIKINNLYYYDRLEVNVYKERFKEDIDKLLSILRGEE